ncbi:hypothetical protein TSAR_008113, partial [Trichomalopsis sarcophagae]
CYPTLYDQYKELCLEWQRTSRQNFIAGLTFKQLIELPTNLFLHIAKTCAFQNREAIQQIINKRVIWKEHEERLQEITYENGSCLGKFGAYMDPIQLLGISAEINHHND